MATEVEAAVMDVFVRLMPDLAHVEVEPSVDMVEAYGLTSLNKVLLVMSLCDELAVDVTTLSELDLIEMRTLADVAAAMEARQPVARPSAS
jgi:hypothetical protein